MGTVQGGIGGDQRGQLANELIARDPAAFVGTGGNTTPIRSMTGQQTQSINAQFNPNVTFASTGLSTGGVAGRGTATLGLTALGGLGGVNSRGFGGVGGLGGIGGFGGVGGLNSGFGRNQFGGGFNQFGGGNQFGQFGGQTGVAQQPLRSRMTAPSLPQPTMTPTAVAKFEDRLTKLPRLGLSTPIQATLQGRTLILEGVVESENVRDLIGRLAMLEPGISDVRNDLTVDLQPATAPSLP